MSGLFDELRTLYDDVDRRRGDVDEMRRQLDGEASQLEKQRHEIDEHRAGLDEKREQLAEATQRLCEAKRELEEQREAGNRQAADDHTELKKELDAVRAERRESTSENVKLKDRLAALEADLVEAQAQLTSGDGQGGSSEFEGELRKQVQELINERSTVELQLESVRDRAAELTERLEEQDRQFAAERKRWQSELGEVSRLLTLNSRYGNGAPSDAAPNATVMVDRSKAATHDDEASEPPAANPVVDSVMAQFRAVQKAAAKRRVGAK